MAQSVFPDGWVEPAVIQNYVQIAAERGLSLAQVADDVSAESPALAAELRKLGAGADRAKAAPAKPRGRAETPKD